jgi:hypothetical protein
LPFRPSIGLTSDCGGRSVHPALSSRVSGPPRRATPVRSARRANVSRDIYLRSNRHETTSDRQRRLRGPPPTTETVAMNWIRSRTGSTSPFRGTGSGTFSAVGPVTDAGTLTLVAQERRGLFARAWRRADRPPTRQLPGNARASLFRPTTDFSNPAAIAFTGSCTAVGGAGSYSGLHGHGNARWPSSTSPPARSPRCSRWTYAAVSLQLRPQPRRQANSNYLGRSLLRARSRRLRMTEGTTVHAGDAGRGRYQRLPEPHLPDQDRNEHPDVA